MANKRLCISGEQIGKNAKVLATKANEQLPTQNRIALKLSEGLHESFKRHGSLRLHSLLSENEEVDKEALTANLPKLIAKSPKWKLEHI